jgi:hypothetical protein
VGAQEAWEKSLALDPLPVRAPLAVDGVIREVGGTRVVDLASVLGPLPEGALFTDILHPSEAGARRVAEVVARSVVGAL